MRLLLVEDDPSFGVILEGAFAKGPFVTEWVGDGLIGAKRARDQAYDLILLDMALPGCDGLEVCRRLRSARIDTPILVLSGRGGLDERVRLLDAGADDFLVKPIQLPELLARVRALTRRGRSRHLSAELRYGPLTVDPTTHVATLAGHPLVLTATEFRLLHCLIQRAATIVTRQQLIQHVWGGMLPPRTNTPEVYISYLREKLTTSGRSLIRTVRGMGYILTDDDSRRDDDRQKRDDALTHDTTPA
jgi:two-component system OmpR family response regulator